MGSNDSQGGWAPVHADREDQASAGAGTGKSRDEELLESWMDPAVTGRVLSAYRSAPRSRVNGRDIQELTARELDVLTLIGRGCSNTEIAEKLCISGVTVKSHVGHIFVKLGLRDRSAAIVYAFDRGIVTPG